MIRVAIHRAAVYVVLPPRERRIARPLTPSMQGVFEAWTSYEKALRRAHELRRTTGVRYHVRRRTRLYETMSLAMPISSEVKP